MLLIPGTIFEADGSCDEAWDSVVAGKVKGECMCGGVCVLETASLLAK